MFRLDTRLFLKLSVFAALIVWSGGIRAQDTVASLKTLPNGLRIIVKRKTSFPLVAVDIWVKAGSGKESSGESGAAHFLEHLIFKGTATRKPGEIDAAIEDLGASLNAGTTQNACHFYTTVAKSHFETAIEVMSDALQRASLDSAQVELERSVILDEIARSKNDEAKQIRNVLNANIFSGTPFSSPVLSDPTSIKALTRDRISGFYQKWYVPNNVAIVIVGDLSVAEAEQVASKYFSSWLQKPLTDNENKDSPITGTSPPLPNQVTFPYGISFGLETPVTQKDLIAGRVIAAILEGTPWGRLRSQLKANLDQLETPPAPRRAVGIRMPEIQPIVRPISAIFDQVGKGCSIYFTTRVNQRGQGVFASLIETETSKLQKDLVSAVELNSAVRYLKGRYLFETETFGGLARAIGEMEIAGNFASGETYLADLDSIRASDIRNFALRIFEPAHSATAYLPIPGLDLN